LRAYTYIIFIFYKVILFKTTLFYNESVKTSKLHVLELLLENSNLFIN
jgi:hypothetical protein